jgi:hypothetical protein
MRGSIAIFIFLIIIAVYCFLPYLLPPHVLKPKPSSLDFTIRNWGYNEHKVSVVVNGILNETYILGPKERIDGSIPAKKDEYTFKVTLDDNITREYVAVVDVRRGPVSIVVDDRYGKVKFEIRQSIAD